MTGCCRTNVRLRRSAHEGSHLIITELCLFSRFTWRILDHLSLKLFNSFSVKFSFSTFQFSEITGLYEVIRQLQPDINQQTRCDSDQIRCRRLVSPSFISQDERIQYLSAGKQQSR